MGLELRGLSNFGLRRLVRPLAPIKPVQLCLFIPTAQRWSLIQTRPNSSLPKSGDESRDLQSNDWKSRLPKFPLHKDIAPTLIPKNTPRVSKDLSFQGLMDILHRSRGPELIYMAESHRLYFLACLALTFVCSYNLFDLLDRGIRGLVELYQDNEQDDPAVHNAVKTGGRVGILALLASAYIVAGLTFAFLPTRLVRRIEYLPGPVEHLRLVTHPWIPGKPSPVITVPLENLTIGRKAKVWTGDGFYGTSHRSSFFFFVYEKGKRLPWIVDRSGWFWGDGRVYDVLLGKEKVAEAEKGLSWDDMLVLRNNAVKAKETELRRELGPAWRMKMISQMVKEDAKSLGKSEKAKELDASSARQLGLGDANHSKKDSNRSKK